MYEKFYGFSQKPFELTLAPKFLYLTPGHQNALTSMVDGIKNRKGVISVTGEVGTGKTTLVHALLGFLDDHVKTAFVFHTTITFKDLLGMVLKELGLEAPGESKARLLHLLIQYLAQVTARDEAVVIIIDDAQNLSEKVLEEIQTLYGLHPMLTQFILVGQPELEDKLRSAALRQLREHIGIRCEIRPLQEQESEEYIDHRLRLVGSSSVDVFTQEAISMICNYAKGIPRVINVLCDNALLKGYGLSRKKIDRDILLEVMQEIEGPGSQKTILSPSVTVNRSRSFLKSNFSLRKVFLTALVILCLSGLLLLIRGYLIRKPTQTWDIESIKNSRVDAEPPPPAVTPSVPPSIPAAVVGEEKKVKQIVTVREKQTISYLTREYYGTVNKTRIDLISNLNPEIKNVHLILVNQKIRIPYITEESLIIHSPGPTYKIHVGTFETPGAAKRYIDAVELRGKRIEAVPRQVSPRETWYRVIIGTFDDKADALKTIRLLKEKNLLPAFGGLPGVE